MVIGRNPDPDSSLPFLVRLPLGRDGLVLKTRETWPRTSKVYCHRADGWPEDTEVLERIPVRTCNRRGPAGRQSHLRSGLLGRPRRLPEDHLPTAGVGHHQLRAILPPPVEDQVDRRSAPVAGPHRNALEHLGVLGPAVGPVAVDLGGTPSRIAAAGRAPPWR